MKLKWLGHSCFLITSETGLRIITDPYAVDRGVKYAPINEASDIVTVSHEHFDHSSVSEVSGNPEVVEGVGSHIVKRVQFRGIATYHDEENGAQRGANTVFCFSIDGINICHSGDLGHRLSSEQINQIGGVDILLVPVGGYFTIDAVVATQVCDDLEARVIIPMHYKTTKLDYPVAGVDDFLRGKKNVRRLDSSEVEFSAENLPDIAEIFLLKSAL